MRRRTASAAMVVEAPKKKRLTLRRKGQAKEPENGKEVEVATEESTLVRDERLWLRKRLEVALQKTRTVLDAVKSDFFADDDVFDDIFEMQSLQIVLTALNGLGNEKESLPTQVFMSMFTDEEWNELQVSEQAIADADEGKLRLLRLNRQYNLFWDAQSIAIDLTVRDEDVAGEQTELVKKSVLVMKAVLDRMGMSGRAVVRALPVAAQSSARNARAKQKNPKGVVVKQKGKTKSSVVIKKKVVAKKREERSQEVDKEEEEEVLAKEGVKKAKTSSEDNDEVDEEEEEEQEEQEDNNGQMMEEDDEEKETAERVDVETMLGKAKLDVDVVLRMLKERSKKGGLMLKISKIDVPDAKCASAKAGSVVLLDDVKLGQCLCESSIPDDWHAVERWGVLLKWWRLVNRCFAITGVFAHLRAQKERGGANLRKRYVKEVGRLKQQKVYSYSQAAMYDRLGRFLVQYPGFVYQLQLVSLADWCQDVGDDGDGKMIKCLETSLFGGEKGAFWKQQPQIEKAMPIL
jgi:hypothetical protein